MEFLKRYWTQIKAQLEGLSVSQKWAISVTLVLGLLLAGLAVMLAGQAEMVAISPATSGRTAEVLSRLQQRGIDAEEDGGQIMVPTGQQHDAYAVLAEGDLLSADTTQAFQDLIERQSPWQTDKQNQQAYQLAKQRVLGQIINKISNVDRANVVISMPRDQGFGSNHVRPTATVTVWMEGGERVSDSMVDSVARLVAGAEAEMPAQNVSVTDGNHGRTRTIQDDDEMLPTEALEYVERKEKRYREKIKGILGYIQGVRVAVNVRISDVAQSREVVWDYPDQQPLDSEMSETLTRREAEDGGQPGARPNTGEDIYGGGGPTVTEEQSREETTFKSSPLTGEQHITRDGRRTQQVNSTINVPRRYFVQLYKSANPDAQDEPTDQDLQPIITQQTQQIRQQVEPQVQAEGESVVQVSMVPDETVLPAAPASAPQAGVGAVLTSGWIKPISIAVLALASLLLMFSMVRKATKKEQMPSVDELAGVPPSLEAEDELYGDADDSEAPMAGVELNEDELKSRKIAEQLNDMIKENPAEAGQLLSRWAQKQE